MKKYKVHLNISFENKGHYGTAKFVEAENAKEAVLKVMEKVSFDGKCEINITVVEVKA